MTTLSLTHALGSIALLAFLPSTTWACASCGCTLSSDWATSNTAGLRLDLRYDYINQTQLRHVTSQISPSAASQIVNQGNAQEVEQFTKNQYVTAAADYGLGADWRIGLQVPYVVRTHSTLGTASDGFTGGAGGGQYSSDTSNLGDVRLTGHYFGVSPQHNLGVVFGVKLPTGKFNLKGTSTDVTVPGPAAIDRGLQPGSGTMDMIGGVDYADALSQNWDYFAQGLYQIALNHRDNYQPGNGLNVNLGVRYMGISWITPQMQLNARNVTHDRGSVADTVSTGGFLAYVSPGVLVPVTEQGALYAFFQLPIYQDVNGVQLVPTSTVSAGARYSF